MLLLLEEKKKSCPKFVEAQKATVGKRIVHNVASHEWGTGLNGKGKN